MSVTRTLLALAALCVPVATSAQTYGGSIDAQVTITITSTSLIRSLTTVTYFRDLSTDLPCTGDQCHYELQGNHKIFNATQMIAGINFRINRYQYRGSLTAGSVADQCYFAQVDTMTYHYMNPPQGAPPYLLAELDEAQSETECTPPPDKSMSECPTSPIIISALGSYELTSATDGVKFDIDADGTREQVAWTGANSDLAFLALDRNGNGQIDGGRELFGDYTLLSDGTVAANGFDAVRDLDWNHDGWLDAGDPAWQSLVLWIDANHDGTSAPSELIAIRDSSVTGISADYRRVGRKDPFGNEFRYKGEVRLAMGSRSCYDVYLTTLQ